MEARGLHRRKEMPGMIYITGDCHQDFRRFDTENFPEQKEMTKEEKSVACYQHACILYERNEMLTNQAVRERFGLDKNKNSVASRIIAECVERGFLKPYDDENTSRKFTSYLPFYG